MKVGTLVMLVGSDGYMPPFGSIGEIVEPLDSDGDYGVLFPKHPCPARGLGGAYEPQWYAKPSWLMPIDGGLPAIADEREYAL
jgi:hypothetical protein